jgi:hypothetical protein
MRYFYISMSNIFHKVQLLKWASPNGPPGNPDFFLGLGPKMTAQIFPDYLTWPDKVRKNMG